MVGVRLKAQQYFSRILFLLGIDFQSGKAKTLSMLQHFGLSKGETANEN
jgi:hypothetical protein